MRSNKNGKMTTIFVILFFVFLGVAVWMENADVQDYNPDVLFYRVQSAMQKEIRYHVFPCFGYVGEKMWENDISLEEEIFRTEIPLYECLAEEMNLAYATEDAFLSWNDMRVSDYEEQILSENKTTDDSQLYDEMLHENQHAAIFARETDFFTCGSGFISEISALWITEFVKASSKSVEYEYDKLADYEFVMENFYTVDACTAAGPDVIRPEEFLAYDATVDKSAPGPHILIYHTHSQEAFADSVPGDKSTTIVGAGAKLSELLREEYGYEVYHHTGEYDVNTRDDAYAKSAPALEEILNQYPQIQVIIDLHRDGVAESRHLVTEWEGKKIAQFMFFNGLSYLNTKGTIDYLPNPNLSGNLALSYQASVTANEYYPGVARRTYLNGYRYNMHYREKTLLIELGAQTNTVDEIMSACEPLAHILDMVFSGEEKEG